MPIGFTITFPEYVDLYDAIDPAQDEIAGILFLTVQYYLRRGNRRSI